MNKLYFFLLALIIPLTVNNYAISKNTWSLFFTDPGPSSRLNPDNPELGLKSLINSARETIDLAFYDIDSPAIAEALIWAKRRGVSVRIVTEDKNTDRAPLTKIINSEIPVVTDGKNGLMHNKFAIIDRNVLWTGSYNATVSGAYYNNNNALSFISKELSAIYLDEFNEMFERRIFGNRKEPGPFHRFRNRYYVKLNNTNINCYFSPENNIERILLKRIQKAKKNIFFMAFSFTSNRIGEALIYKHKKGITVKGIFEARGSGSRYSEYMKMKIEGLPVKLDKNRYVMHHKVIIIDEHITITGSYNFSKNAHLNNDENIIIIDNKEVSASFLGEFRRLYK